MSEGQRQYKGFRRLLAWQKADDLAVAVYKSTGALERKEWWFVNQIRRAALSVPGNMAEGYSRRSLREYLQALGIANGSLAEVEYYLHFAGRTELLDKETTNKLERLRRDAAGLLFLLMKGVREKIAKSSGPAIRETSGRYGDDRSWEDQDWDDPNADSLTHDP